MIKFSNGSKEVLLQWFKSPFLRKIHSLDPCLQKQYLQKVNLAEPLAAPRPSLDPCSQFKMRDFTKKIKTTVNPTNISQEIRKSKSTLSLFSFLTLFHSLFLSIHLVYIYGNIVSLRGKNINHELFQPKEVSNLFPNSKYQLELIKTFSIALLELYARKSWKLEAIND